MFLGRVIGEVVATVKHPSLEGFKILVIDMLATDRTSLGESVLAVDAVDAGVGDFVLVVDEGSSAALVTGLPDPPIRTVVVGVVDEVDAESGKA